MMRLLSGGGTSGRPAGLFRSERLGGVPEYVEVSAGEAVSARDECLFRAAAGRPLGMPDLVWLRKRGDAPLRLQPPLQQTAYHWAVGLPLEGGSAAVAAYIARLAGSLERAHLLNMLAVHDWQVSNALYCCYDAVRGVDVRVEVNMPGGCVAYTVDAGGKIDESEPTDEQWATARLSAWLRACAPPAEALRAGCLQRLEPFASQDEELDFLELAAAAARGADADRSPRSSALLGDLLSSVRAHLSCRQLLARGAEWFATLAADGVGAAEAYAWGFLRAGGRDTEAAASLARARADPPSDALSLIELCAALCAEGAAEAGAVAAEAAVGAARAQLPASGAGAATLARARLALSRARLEARDAVGALTALNACPPAAMTGEDRGTYGHAVLPPAPSHSTGRAFGCAPDPDAEVAMRAEEERLVAGRDEDLLRLPAGSLVRPPPDSTVQPAPLSEAYSILSDMVELLGWDGFLAARSEAFVVELSDSELDRFEVGAQEMDEESTLDEDDYLSGGDEDQTGSSADDFEPAGSFGGHTRVEAEPSTPPPPNPEMSPPPSPPAERNEGHDGDGDDAYASGAARSPGQPEAGNDQADAVDSSRRMRAVKSLAERFEAQAGVSLPRIAVSSLSHAAPTREDSVQSFATAGGSSFTHEAAPLTARSRFADEVGEQEGAIAPAEQEGQPDAGVDAGEQPTSPPSIGRRGSDKRREAAALAQADGGESSPDGPAHVQQSRAGEGQPGQLSETSEPPAGMAPPPVRKSSSDKRREGASLEGTPRKMRASRSLRDRRERRRRLATAAALAAGKAECADWLDTLVGALYEDLRCYLDWRAAEARAERGPLSASAEDESEYHKALLYSSHLEAADWARRGELCERLGRLEDAERCYRAAVHEGFSATAWSRLLSIYSELGWLRETLVAAGQLLTACAPAASDESVSAGAPRRAPYAVEAAACRLIAQRGLQAVREEQAEVGTPHRVLNELFHNAVRWQCAGFHR